MKKFDPMLDNFRGPKLGDFAWAMHNYWLHYRYLGDWKSIQDKWVPKAIKIAEAFEKFQQRNSIGQIELLPMGSPEYKGFVTYPNTNYNLAILRWLLSSLIESNENVGLNTIEIAKWKQTLANLIPYPVDANGLMIAGNQPVDMSHRHYSHLLGLYPLFQLNPDSPADRELVDKSVVHWHQIENGKALAGYSYTGAASLYAALGRGNDANQILQHFLLGDIGISQLLSNTMYVESGGRNPVLETPLSAAASIMELLLQSWGGKIRVFPAVPDDWKEASFHQLRAQGGFLVSASRSQGKTDWISVKSLSGEPCVVKVPNWTNAVQTGKGKKIPVSKIAQGEFKIDLKTGEEILLKSSENEINAEILPVACMKDEKNLYGVKKGKNLKNDQSWPLPEYDFRK
jgi:alpha-L-fucosidase 2